jgi:hypothetical protein
MPSMNLYKKHVHVHLIWFWNHLLRQLVTFLETFKRALITWVSPNKNFIKIVALTASLNLYLECQIHMVPIFMHQICIFNKSCLYIFSGTPAEKCVLKSEILLKLSKRAKNNIKVLSQVKHAYEIQKPLTIQNIWPKSKFLKSRSNFKVTRSKIIVPLESSCHKEHTYEIW